MINVWDEISNKDIYYQFFIIFKFGVILYLISSKFEWQKFYNTELNEFV